MDSSECDLCYVVDDSLKNGNNSQVENRLLYSTKSFIVTPCIGPLVPGHIMIVSKKHYENLSCMDIDTINEINEINQLLFGKLNKYYSDCIIAEHGAYDFQQKSGACIIHTHLHIIPKSRKSIETFDKLLIYIELNDLSELIKIKYPYILVTSNKFLKIYNAENVPSQMIRRIVLASKGETKNWDWRTNSNNNYNKQTLKIWDNV